MFFAQFLFLFGIFPPPRKNFVRSRHQVWTSTCASARGRPPSEILNFITYITSPSATRKVWTKVVAGTGNKFNPGKNLTS
jgi:hypothetical protein